MSGSHGEFPFSGPIFPPFHPGLARRPANAPEAERTATEETSPPFAPAAEPRGEAPSAPELEAAPWETPAVREPAAEEAPWEAPAVDEPAADEAAPWEAAGAGDAPAEGVSPQAGMPWDSAEPADVAPGTDEDEAGGWDASGDDDEDLPWLELPEGAPQARAEPAAEEPAAPADAVESDSPAGLPAWMDWESPAAKPPASAGGEVPPEVELQPWDIAPEARDPEHPEAEVDPWRAPETPEADEDEWRAPEDVADAGEPWRAPDTPDAEEPWRAPEPELGRAPELGIESAGAFPGGDIAEEPEEPQAFEPPAGPLSAEAGAAPWDSFEPHLVPLGDFSAETPAPAAAAPAPAGASGQDAALARALGGVADRLESIARALRERPADFLAGGGTDPLELLITGFALGYAQGKEAGNG